MRFVSVMLAVAILGAGVGLVSVAPVQAHGGDGGGQIEVMQGFANCPVVVNVENAATPSMTSCHDLIESGDR